MRLARPSLAWKIAAADILLVLFAVLLAGLLQYQKDQHKRLNQQLLSRATRGLFVTMTYLVLGAKTGEVCYSTVGHLPVLRRNGANQDVEILYGDEGLPLGIEKEPLLADRKIQLAPGDTLLLVTDGVVEPLGPDRNVFTMDRLAEVFSQNGTGAGKVVEGVFKEISRVSPEAGGDDLTVLAVTWTPAHQGSRS
jgi:sigma-B regulation protein RsbU (phosphoserine phosphatase)